MLINTKEKHIHRHWEETCAHIFWLSPFDRTLDVFLCSFFSSFFSLMRLWLISCLTECTSAATMMITTTTFFWADDDDVREGAVKREGDRRRMRLWLFDRARCSSVSYGRVVIVVKTLLLCVNRPWFLSFLCFPSCHSLYLSNKREFIELNESSTTVVSQSVFHSDALEKEKKKESSYLGEHSWQQEMHLCDTHIASRVLYFEIYYFKKNSFWLLKRMNEKKFGWYMK
jgi:hypothetical protein